MKHLDLHISVSISTVSVCVTDTLGISWSRVCTRGCAAWCLLAQAAHLTIKRQSRMQLQR